jgi:6-phosphogluconolactonase
MPKLTLVILIALSLFLGCGKSHPVICDLPASFSSSTCTCDSGACPAMFDSYIYAAGTNSQITIFPLQALTGVIQTPTSSAGPAASPGIAAIGSAYLYASNPQAAGGGAIDAWTINSNTGALTPVPGSPFSAGGVSLPAGLAVADGNAVGSQGATGPFLYVADAGKIDALQVDNNGIGTLTAVPGSPFTSGTNLYLTVDPMSRFVFAADEDPPGGVLAFTINAMTGALTAVPGSPFAISSNPSGSSQLGQIAVDSSGSFVYVAMTSTAEIAAFSIGSGGVLSPVPGSPFAAGSGAFAITTANGAVYVSNNSAGTVSGYRINPTTGALSPVAGSPFSIDATTLATDFGYGHLYASGPTGLMVFSINASSGSLTQVGSPVAFPGATELAYAGP